MVCDPRDLRRLCPVRFTLVRAGIDLSHVSSTSSDYVVSSLAQAVNQPAITEVVVRSWIDLAWPHRRSTLVFAVNVAHIGSIVREFQRCGVDARPFHSGMLMSERDATLDAFRQGTFPVLVNCAILTEGADVPPIDCVLLLRPTKSKNLFSQMIGRGMRLSEGKKDCLILDVVGNVENDLVCTPTLFGLDANADIQDDTVDELRERASAMNAHRTRASSFLEPPDHITYVDYNDPRELQKAMASKTPDALSKISPNAWVDCGDDVYVLGSWNGAYLKLRRQSDQWIAYYYSKNAAFWKDYQHGIANTIPFFKRQVVTSNDFVHAMHGCDTYMQRLFEAANRSPMWLRRSARWRSLPASSKAKAMLQNKMQGRSQDGLSIHEPLSQGALQRALLRLSHGARGVWRSSMKRRNRESARNKVQQVQVGPLARM
ncbi:putative ATP-dependent helicase Irc3 [Malassezia pachydermatis]